MNLVPDTIDLSAYFEEIESQKVKPASAFMEQVLAELDRAGPPPAARLPWRKLHGRFDIRPGEMTLWAGQNGVGKTFVIQQAMATLMRQNESVLIASFELPPDRTIKRFLRQAFRTESPSIEYARRWHRWTDGRLWLFDHTGAFGGQKMLAVMHWAHANIAIRHVVVDSLMKLDIGVDDYTAQKQLVNRMQAFAMKTGVHVHLVAHARKTERETDRIDKFSVKGAGEIVDQPDNVVLISRNSAKDRQIEQWEHERRDFDNPSDDMLEVLSQPDTGMRIAKQRSGDWEGSIPLWLDRRSRAFSDSPNTIVPAMRLEDLVPLDREAILEREAIQAEGAG